MYPRTPDAKSLHDNIPTSVLEVSASLQETYECDSSPRDDILTLRDQVILNKSTMYADQFPSNQAMTGAKEMT